MSSVIEGFIWYLPSGHAILTFFPSGVNNKFFSALTLCFWVPGHKQSNQSPAHEIISRTIKSTSELFSSRAFSASKD